MLKTKKLTRAGIIASLYVVLSFLTFPVSSGAIQFRIAEGLTILALLYVEAIPALFIGCLITNIVTGCAIFDIIFGSIITLIASLCTYLIGRKIKKAGLKIFIGGLFPVILNSFLLPLVWFYMGGKLEYIYIVSVLFVFLGESVSVYIAGSIFFIGINKLIKRSKNV